MSSILLPMTRFIPRDNLPDRIQAAERMIELILQKHNLQFSLRCVTYQGRTLHTEIVIVDREG